MQNLVAESSRLGSHPSTAGSPPSQARGVAAPPGPAVRVRLPTSRGSRWGREGWGGIEGACAGRATSSPLVPKPKAGLHVSSPWAGAARRGGPCTPTPVHPRAVAGISDRGNQRRAMECGLRRVSARCCAGRSRPLGLGRGEWDASPWDSAPWLVVPPGVPLAGSARTLSR